MAWPDTADFPENWEGLVGYDGTDYDGTWVLDTATVASGKAASLRTNPGPNGWCAIKTPLFTYQHVAPEGYVDTINIQWRHDAVRTDSQAVLISFFHEDGTFIDSSRTYYEGSAANEWHGLGFGFSSRLVAGQRYFIVIAAKFPGITYWLGGFQLSYSLVEAPYYVNYDFDADTADIIRTPAPALPNAGDLDTWPGPLDPYYGLPAGWVIDYPQFFVDMGEAWLNAVPNPVVGSNGAGVSLPLAFTAKFANEALNNIAPGVYHGTDLWAVSPEAPAGSVVSFDYLNGMEVDIYTSTGLPFTYDESTQIDEILDVNATGWKRATYTVGDQPVHLIIFQRSRDAPLIYSLFGPYYASAIDNFVIQPLTVSDGDATDEVGMVVDGTFRWEPNVMAEDAATATESVMGVPYTGWTTDPEWPIWHAGSPTYLPPTDPGTAWDFLDDVAYADQDYGVGVSGTIVIRASASLTDAGIITDELDAPDEPVLESRAIVFDQHEPLAFGRTLVDNALPDEVMFDSVVGTLIVEDPALATDAGSIAVTHIFERSATATEELVLSALAPVVGDEAVADEVLTPSAASVLVLEDLALASEEVSGAFAPVVESLASATEEPAVLAAASLLSEATADEVAFDGTDARDAVVDVEAEAEAELFITQTSVAELTAEAVADDTALYAMPGAIAWVLNTETGAVSWYVNWRFTDMVQVGDKVLAIGPEGLSVLGADTDNGDAIQARVEYDFNEFGGYDRDGSPNSSEYKKRIDNFWVGYTSNGNLRFAVETYGQGYGVLRYNLERRAAKEPRNSRVNPGKGLNARWWKIAIENVAGAQFEITSLSADVAQSNRRA